MATEKKKSRRVKVTCGCGASLMAPKKAIGKKVKCPRCGKIITVTDPGSTVDRLIYALSDEQYNKPALEEQPPPLEAQKTEKGQLCPRCDAEMSMEAVFCVRCGHHLDRNAALEAASEGGGLGAFFSRLFKRK